MTKKTEQDEGLADFNRLIRNARARLSRASSHGRMADASAHANELERLQSEKARYFDSLRFKDQKPRY